MDYMTDGLTFNTLRGANMARLPQFRGRNGQLAHPPPHGDGSNWTLSDWMMAATGELGETANVLKKILRGDYTLEEKREELGREIADVVTYLDILANQAGIDLGRAVLDKFNEISVRAGSDVRIKDDGSDWRHEPPATR